MIGDVAVCLLTEAAAAWASTGRPVPPSARVYVGSAPYDDCCDPGLLMVTVDALAWFNPFPVEQGGQVTGIGAGSPMPRPCFGSLGAYTTVHIGLCVPVVDERGVPPSPAAESRALLDVLDLAEVIATRLACDSDCWTIGPTAFLGPEGGCFAAQISLRVDGTCDPCPGTL